MTARRSPDPRRRIDPRAPSWLEPLPVNRWMRQPVVTIPWDAPAKHAAALLRDRSIRHLPVVDGGGRLVGIVTDRDLRQIVFDPSIQARLGALGDALESLTVREVMTWGVLTVTPRNDIREGARLMHERKIGALPVVEDGRVVGMLSEHDVLRAFEELARQRVATVSPLGGAPTGPYEYGFVPAVDDARPREETASD